MEHNHVFLDYENIMRNYPCTVMTKAWRPQFPGPPVASSKEYSKLLIPDKIRDIVINSPRLRTLLDTLYTDKADLNRSMQNIVGILMEIGMGRSLTTIRSFGLLIEYMVRKVHMSLYINRPQVERIKAAGARNPVLYLPTHRSYADFILFSYLCFYFDMEVPTVAAGMDFKHMKVLGKLMSQAGAFYMRRKFVDDKLYWNVFKEFIRSLVTSFNTGFEFFIEGTRSRTMKALTPKIGLLSMALEPFFMGQVVNITIVPVSISYERPLEEQLFAYELLGVPKPKESTMGLFKSILALGNQYYGSTYVHYHEPISVKEFFGVRANRFQHAHEPAHVQQLTRGELEMVQELAEYVIDQQQRFIVIQPFNLVAVYLSHCSQTSRGLTGVQVVELCEQVLILGRLLGRMGAITNVDPGRIRQQVEDTLKTHEALLHRKVDEEMVVLKKPTINTHKINSVKFKAHRLGDDTMQECLPLVGLQLYVNPCLYWTAMPALMLAAVRRLYSNRCAVLKATVDALRVEVNLLRQIFATEFVFTAAKEAGDFERTLNQLQDFNLITLNGDGLVVEQNEHRQFGDTLIATITPYLCTYYQVLKTVAQYFPSLEFTETVCLARVQCCVEEQLRQGKRDVHPYCLCLEAISTALGQFTKMGVLQREKKGDGSTTIKANLPELHRMHCHLQHLCAALNFSYYIKMEDEGVVGNMKAKL